MLHTGDPYHPGGYDMNIEELRETLESLKDSELIHHVQKYVCLSLTEVNNPTAVSHTLLDLVYAECIRRGKERLYDKAYESVCRQPQVCKVLLAA
jgi:hypothetical protein